MSSAEALAAHRALVSAWARLYAKVEGARFEQRSDDLILAIWPGLAMPPCNGPWVEEDSELALSALPGAIGEVDASGEEPWVQSRARHRRAQQVAGELGLTHVERLPVMVARPEELTTAPTSLDVAPVGDEDVAGALDVLARAFEEPRELFVRFHAPVREIAEARWYVGRLDGAIVSTALGLTTDGATGIFNVATLKEHRRLGYGATLTARAAVDGFADGAELAYLHASPSGRGVYRRLGFRDVDEYVVQTRPRGT